MTIVSLDSGPLSLVTQKRGTAEGDACRKWLSDHLARGTRVVVPEIVDYELRRELLRARKAASIKRLDAFIVAEADRLIPLTRGAILRAAQLWASPARRDWQRRIPRSWT